MADELEPIKVPGVPVDRAWSNFQVCALWLQDEAAVQVECHLCPDWSWPPGAESPQCIQLPVLADVVEDHWVTRHGGLPRG